MRPGGRTLRRILFIAGLGVAAVAVWVRLLGGGPVVSGIPGGWLRGETVGDLPSDWSFANRAPYLLVESRAWTLPYSVRVWFLAHGGRLYLLLPDFFGDGLQRRLADDPRLTVALGGRLHPQIAVPLPAGADLSPLVRPVLRRQFAIEVEGRVRPVRGDDASRAGMSIYRLDDPPREAQ